MPKQLEKAYSTQDTRWQAVANRDVRADGSFYYAVLSTHIYCRPTCPSKRPKRENVVFFDSPESAQVAGFRPCLRCRPDEVSRQQKVVAHIQHLLEKSESTPTLAEMGKAVEMSPYHLQRIFKRITGLSPRQYAAARRTEIVKTGLRNGASVTEAIYDAGYGSTRAFYSIAQEQLGMKPGAYKNGGLGERITYALADCPLGRMLVAATTKGVCALRFGEDDALVEGLKAEFPRAVLVLDAQTVMPFVQPVLHYLEGQAQELALPLHVKATDFQERVWAALRKIPYGETRSYREVAEMIGQPNAARAVARACATNPVALVIPCHRVVGANGKLRGYRWGVHRKQTLLDKERL